jgi:hypothetical protein
MALKYQWLDGLLVIEKILELSIGSMASALSFP